jgi:hypothetical protein
MYALRHPPQVAVEARRRLTHGGTVPESHDVEQLLIRVIEMLRMHQESLFKVSLEVNAAVEALKEGDAHFAESYDRHYWEAKQGRLGEENSTAVRMIDQLKRELRAPNASGASSSR